MKEVARHNGEQDTLVSRFREAAARYPQYAVVKNGDQVLGFQTFDRLSDNAAHGLARNGVRPGDRVALYCVNSDAFPLAYMAILKAGATVVPINTLLKPDDVAYMLEDSGATAMVYHGLFADAVAVIRQRAAGVSCFVRIGPSAEDGDVRWADLCAGDGGAAAPATRPDDVAAILYTSGTTGRPKGAMLTHRNLVYDTDAIMAAMKFVPGEETLLVVLPMFHAFAATAGMLTPLLNGLAMIPVPRFDPLLVTNAVESGGATIFLGVPGMFNAMSRLPDAELNKLRRLKYCVSGGASLPPALMDRFESRTGVAIYEGDGPTECGPVTCVNPIGGRRKPGSVGLPVPGVEMAIFDDKGDAVADEVMGEICVRGANVMKGYWKRPEETAACFFDEWFRTGDLGYRDSDGYFYIVDRIKDMVIVNGMNVYPRKIEDVLFADSRVQEAAVVGEPHESHGEIPVAYVVPREGVEVSERDLRQFCREKLAVHEVPRKIYFVDALPKNAAGKVLKRELRRSGEVERGVDLPPFPRTREPVEPGRTA